MNVYYCEELPRGISQHQLAYLLLEYLIQSEHPEVPHPFHYEKRAGGKPWLREYPWLEFNVTHCSFCVAAACGTQSVGVDAERRFPWKASLARRIGTPEELRFLESRKRGEQEAWLQRIWSRKESCLKCTGIGLRKDLRQVPTLGEEELEFLKASDAEAYRAKPPGETGVKPMARPGKALEWKSDFGESKTGAIRRCAYGEDGREPEVPRWRRIEPEPGHFFWIQEFQTPEYTMAVCMKKREPVVWSKRKPEEFIP